MVNVLVNAILDLRDAAPGYISLEGATGEAASQVSSPLPEPASGKNPTPYRRGLLRIPHFATTDRLVEALVVTIERALNERYSTFDAGKEFRAYYKTLRPVLTSALPLGLPEPPDDRRTAKERLEALLGPVQRPIVIFLEDLDRMRGEDLLILRVPSSFLGRSAGSCSFSYSTGIDAGGSGRPPTSHMAGALSCATAPVAWSACRNYSTRKPSLGIGWAPTCGLRIGASTVSTGTISLAPGQQWCPSMESLPRWPLPSSWFWSRGCAIRPGS